MFHVDVTIEDSRIIATQTDIGLEEVSSGCAMNVRLIDSHSGKEHRCYMSMDNLTSVIKSALLGLEVGPEYDSADAILCILKCPPECRPIP